MENKYSFIANRKVCPACNSSVLYPLALDKCPKCHKGLFILAEVVKKRLEEYENGKKHFP